MSNHPKCEVCDTPDAAIRCDDCHSAHYCSAKCKKNHYHQHAHVCEALAVLAIGPKASKLEDGTSVSSFKVKPEAPEKLDFSLKPNQLANGKKRSIVVRDEDTDDEDDEDKMEYEDDKTAHPSSSSSSSSSPASSNPMNNKKPDYKVPTVNTTKLPTIIKDLPNINVPKSPPPKKLSDADRFRMLNMTEQKIKEVNAIAEKEYGETKNMLNTFIDTVNGQQIMLTPFLPEDGSNPTEEEEEMYLQVNETLARLYPQFNSSVPFSIDKEAIVDTLEESRKAWDDYYEALYISHDEKLQVKAYNQVHKLSRVLTAQLSGQDVNFILNSEFAKNHQSPEAIGHTLSLPIIEGLQKKMSGESILKTLENPELRQECIDLWKYVSILQSAGEYYDSKKADPMDVTQAKIGGGVTDDVKKSSFSKLLSFLGNLIGITKAQAEDSIQRDTTQAMQTLDPNSANVSSSPTVATPKRRRNSNAASPFKYKKLTPEEENEYLEEARKSAPSSSSSSSSSSATRRRRSSLDNNPDPPNTTPDISNPAVHNNEAVAAQTAGVISTIKNVLIDSFNRYMALFDPGKEWFEVSKNSQDTPDQLSAYLGASVKVFMAALVPMALGGIALYAPNMLAQLARPPEAVKDVLGQIGRAHEEIQGDATTNEARDILARTNTSIVNTLTRNEPNTIDVDQNDFQGMCFPGQNQDIQHTFKSKFIMQRFVDSIKLIYNKTSSSIKRDAEHIDEFRHLNVPDAEGNSTLPQQFEDPNSTASKFLNELAIESTRNEVQEPLRLIYQSRNALPTYDQGFMSRYNAIGGDETNLEPADFQFLWEHRNSLLQRVSTTRSTFFESFCSVLTGNTTGTPLEGIRNTVSCFIYDIADSLGRASNIFRRASDNLNALERQRLEATTQLNIAFANAIGDRPASPLIREEVRQILLQAHSDMDPRVAAAISQRPGTLHGMVSASMNEMDINQAHSLAGRNVPQLRETLRGRYPTVGQTRIAEADLQLHQAKRSAILKGLGSASLMSLNLAINYAAAEAAQSFGTVPQIFFAATQALSLSGLALPYLRARAENEIVRLDQNVQGAGTEAEDKRLEERSSNESSVRTYKLLEKAIHYVNLGTTVLNAYNALGSPSFQNWWTGKEVYGFDIPFVSAASFGIQLTLRSVGMLLEQIINNVHTAIWTLPKSIIASGQLLTYLVLSSFEGTAPLADNTFVTYGGSSLAMCAIVAYYLGNRYVRTERERIKKEYYDEAEMSIPFAKKLLMQMYAMSIQAMPYVLLANGITKFGLFLSSKTHSTAIYNHFAELDLNLKTKIWERIGWKDPKSYLQSLKDSIWNNTEKFWKTAAPLNAPPLITPLELATGVTNIDDALTRVAEMQAVYNNTRLVYDNQVNDLIRNLPLQLRNELMNVNWRPEDIHLLDVVCDGTPLSFELPIFLGATQICMAQRPEVNHYMNDIVFGNSATSNL